MNFAVPILARLADGSDTQKISCAGRAREPAAAGRTGEVVFEAIGKTFSTASGPLAALAEIDLTIAPGEIFGIIGRSGAGKSTLLRLINRLERPSTGKVLIDGQDIAELTESGLVDLRRRVGMVFQHFNLLSAKTVWDNVALPLNVAGIARAEVRRRVAEALNLVGLEAKHDVMPSRLSGGQKQRVGIARAIVSGPEILLCDEATSALDPETTLSILGLLKDVNRRLGLTVVLITHEMSVIREICERVLVLDRGSAVESGPVWRVFGQPRHAATRALLQPFDRALPDDLASRLVSEPARGRARDAVVALRFFGGREPDLSALAARCGGRLRLLDAALDRIAGHTQGRLLVALATAPDRRLPDFSGIADDVEVLGYVDVDD